MKTIQTNLFLLLCALLFGVQSLCAQKMPDDWFEEGIKAYEAKKYNEAIHAFEYIAKHHRANPIFARSYYNLGTLYLEAKKEEKAVAVFEEILRTYSDTNEKESLGGGIMDDPYTNYRHHASSVLSSIYFEQGNYEKSLHYLALSDTVFPYRHFCGNAYASKSIAFALDYAKIYEKMGNHEKALAALIDVANDDGGLADNSKAIAEAKRLLNAHFNRADVKKEVERGLANIYTQERTTSKGKAYINYYFDVYGIRILLAWEYKEDTVDLKAKAEQFRQGNFYKLLEN